MRNFCFALCIALIVYVNQAFGSEAGMPQLNPEFWASQTFWLILIFTSLYLIISKIFLPKIKIPNNVYGTNDLKDLVSCKFIFLCIPSQFIKEIVLQFKKYYKKEMIFVICSKGIEQDSQLLISEIIKKILPQSKIAVLSGPSFAIEVARKLPTAVTVASKNQKDAKALAKLINSRNFRCYYSSDIIGVQLGGVIKNILAIASGIVESQKLGANAKAALLTRGLVEMKRIGLAYGAKESTFYGLSGLGDLSLTCNSILSRNFTTGLLVGKGKKIKQIIKIYLIFSGKT